MRIATVLMAAAMAVGLGASAPADDAGDTGQTDAIPCGCGGPKAIYAAQYGTVQPPAMREASADASATGEDQPPAAQPAAADPETDTGSGG